MTASFADAEHYKEPNDKYLWQIEPKVQRSDLGIDFQIIADAELAYWVARHQNQSEN